MFTGHAPVAPDLNLFGTDAMRCFDVPHKFVSSDPGASGFASWAFGLTIL